MAAIGVEDTAALLERAVRRTSKGTPRGVRRRLDHGEALAATRVVTGMLERYGLRPTVVLAPLDRDATPGAAYPLFLTRAEATGEVDVRDGRRLARSIVAHRDSVRAIAAAVRAEGRGDCDEAGLMAELAAALPDYLSQFEDAAEDPWRLLADDLAAMGRWFSRPARDLDVAGYLRGMGDGGYDYSNDYEVAPDFGPHWRNVVKGGGIRDRGGEDWMLTVNVTTRLLASGIVHIEREGGDAMDHQFHVFQGVDVGLALSSDRRQVRTMFRASNRNNLGWHDVPVPPEGVTLTATPGRSSAGLTYALTVTYDPESCSADLRALLSGQDLGVPVPWTRWVECDAANCELLLSGRQVTEEHRGDGASDLGRSVLPRTVRTDEGVDTENLRDRFAYVLHDDGSRSIVGLLTERALPRVRSWEAFAARAAGGEHGRRQGFRERMRA